MPQNVSDVQTAVWAFIASQESGTLSLDPNDSGNWTSGIVNEGRLVGSKYGISAASFPTLDIAAVTYDSAQTICIQTYWPEINGDALCAMNAAPIAMLLVDANWGSGKAAAVKTLQLALNISDDGDWGPMTEAALVAAIAAPPLWGLGSGLECLIANLTAQRILFESHLNTWALYEGGWVARLTRIESLVHGWLPSVADT